jgi:hypothetical protein
MRMPYGILLATVLLLPVPAGAQDAETAASMQAALRNWLASWPGGQPVRPEPSVHITAQDDHYSLDWPFGGGAADQPGTTFSAALKPLPEGRWLVERMQVEPGTISFDMPAIGNVKPTHTIITLTDQTGHAEFDPTFKSPSTLNMSVGHYETTSDGPSGHGTSRVDQYDTQAEVVPAGDGRLNLALSSRTGPWHMTQTLAAGPAFELSASGLHGESRVEGVSQEAAGALIRAYGALIPLMPAHDTPANAVEKAKADAMRTALHAVFEAMRDSLSSLRTDMALDDLHVSVAGAGGFDLRQLHLAVGGEAPNDRLYTMIDLGLSGISTDAAPPDLEEFVPKDVSLRTSLAGVDLVAATRLMLQITDEVPDPASISASTAALVTDPQAQMRVESLKLTVGPAHLEGNAQVRMLTMQEPEMKAHIVVTGFDALMARINGKPAAQQAIPILLMARGMARADGDRLVWDVVLGKTQAFVNGVDMKALLAGGGHPAPHHP